MTTTTIDRVYEILVEELGENWPDQYGEPIKGVSIGYAEPGYGTNEDVIVMGNWNPKRWPYGEEPPLTEAETVGPHLAERLTEAGAEIEWLDEWVECEDCYRVFRIQGDSYSWKMYGAFVENASGYVCADCLRKDESNLEDYKNDSSRCVTWADPSLLIEWGWTQWEPGDPHQYENGWFHGMDANPEDISQNINCEVDNVDVVFLLDEASQFYIGFSAWTKKVS